MQRHLLQRDGHHHPTSVTQSKVDPEQDRETKLVDYSPSMLPDSEEKFYKSWRK